MSSAVRRSINEPSTCNNTSASSDSSAIAREDSESMIIPSDTKVDLIDDYIPPTDVRTWSPRRNSQEVRELAEGAQRALIKVAALKTETQAFADEVDTVTNTLDHIEAEFKEFQSCVLIINDLLLALLTSIRCIGGLVPPKVTSPLIENRKRRSSATPEFQRDTLATKWSTANSSSAKRVRRLT